MADRQCITSRQSLGEADRIRFVAAPDGSLVPDLAEKLPGRGAYVSANPEFVEQALSRGHFRRHLGDALQKQSDPTDMIANLETLLSKRFIQQLAMARRANLAVIGSGSMRDEPWIEGLFVADDASKREASALQGSLQPDWVEEGLPAEILGAAFGRSSVAYVGLRGSSYASDATLRQQILITLRRWRPFLAAAACHTIG